MAGVVVWSYKNNRNLWSAYEPNVSCELERLFSQGINQTVNLGTVSSNLSCYEVNFTQMTQSTIPSGSVREIKRIVCDPASALGQGVVWEFEADQPNQWAVYDMETMDVIEEGFVKHNQLNTSTLDLHNSRVHLPYIIDFGRMTQMRVETGRIRRIQRRPLNQTFTPVTSYAFGSTSSALPSSTMFSGAFGQASWQHQQPALKVQVAKSKGRYQPYSHKSGGTVSVVNGTFNGLSVQAGLSSQVPQQTVQQQHSQNQGPVTRGRLLQATSSNSASALPLQQHPQIQHPAMQQIYPSTQQQFLHPPVQNLHIPGSYQQHMYGLVPGSLSGFQFPPSSLQQPLPMPPMNILPPPLAHQQISRSSSTSSVSSSSTSSSSSSSSSSMSVSSAQGPEPLPSVSKVSISKSKKSKSKSGVEVLEKYMRSIHTNLDKDDCSICFDKLSEASSYGEGKADAHAAVELNKCGHQFHKLCLLEMYNSIHKDDSIQCPSCKTIYGEKTGNCPPGYMQWRIVHDLTLPGYEGCGTIIVSYHISSGIQGPEHPSPGHRFSARGFPRQGYLPDCDKGRKVLKLLMEAFRRRLMFTIATSHTTGETNTVTWNEIHHKTEPYGNSSGHGYPDPNYLDNALMELAAHGVTEDCLK